MEKEKINTGLFSFVGNTAGVTGAEKRTKPSLLDMQEIKPKSKKIRDTVMTRVSRKYRDEIKRLAKERHLTMSRLNDEALRGFLELQKCRDDVSDPR